MILNEKYNNQVKKMMIEEICKKLSQFLPEAFHVQMDLAINVQVKPCLLMTLDFHGWSFCDFILLYFMI